MYQHSMKKFQIFRINPFTSQFYAKNFTVKTLRSAPKRPLKITKFVTNITYYMVTNQIFTMDMGTLTPYLYMLIIYS